MACLFLADEPVFKVVKELSFSEDFFFAFLGFWEVF